MTENHYKPHHFLSLLQDTFLQELSSPHLIVAHYLKKKTPNKPELKKKKPKQQNTPRTAHITLSKKVKTDLTVVQHIS